MRLKKELSTEHKIQDDSTLFGLVQEGKIRAKEGVDQCVDI
jgi:hypothetical protein